METNEVVERKTKGSAFVEFVLRRLSQDTAFGAALRRADNPSTEYQAWEYLAGWCDLENERERRPFAVVASALAKAKPARDGNLGLGRAIAACFKTDKADGNQSDAAKAKLRRLLACETVAEVCAILRPILSLIESRSVPLNYGELLDDLLWFKAERTRVRWAADFYGRKEVA
ncbi:MAG: type I-E CRISPR-associated protein Cse2/CasB [Spirochaetae bacterium HGW-Spirochaetae-3]|jgi:CRISPR system Cascade subunit CasB|nr:MAG: type I-E CRISPR-associated protein Cse2/CasB [Spirochaetae bacterium HGW-Spirochaetae-3]